MAASVQRVKLRLLVAGVEIPIQSCTVQGTQASASVAAVAVPPHDALADLLPGSVVLVFYYDGRYRTHSYSSGSYLYTSLPADDPRRWKLLHYGMLRGLDRNKGVGGAWSITLHSASAAFLYDRVQQYYGGYKDGGSSSFNMSFLGASSEQGNRRINPDLAGASAPTAVYNTIKRGADLFKGSWVAGIRLLLKKIVVNNHPYWETEYKRLRAGDTVVGFDDDRTSHKLMDLTKFEKYVKDSLGQLGSQVSTRELVNFLLQMIYHCWWETPCPYLSPTKVGLAGRGPAVIGSEDPLYVSGWQDARLCSGYILPELWWATPPACNVLFPDDYSKLQTGRDYYSEATRMFLATEVDLRSNEWARDYHYAPNLPSMASFFTNPNLPAEFNARNATTLLPWERYTGPIGNIHQVDQLPGKVKSDALKAALSHSAAYDYWSLRCERAASLAGPFNPDLAIGLPALVVLDANSGMAASQAPGGEAYTARGASRRGVYPQAMLGRLLSVTHVIDQGSATTYLALGNVRMHDEDFDLDGGRGDDVEQVLNAHESAQQDDLRFFGESYDATRIGASVYGPLLGSRSILDVTGQSWTLGAVDKLVYDYGQRRLAHTASIRETNQALTARPVADAVQVLGDETGAYAGDGYSSAGFLYPALEESGSSKLLYRVKAASQDAVDKNQRIGASDTEPDTGVWSEIQALNSERKAAALAVQRLLRERVFRG